jgi:hypothetical protein
MRALAGLLLASVLAASSAAADDPAPAARRTEGQMAALRKAVLDGFADPRPEVRAAAAQLVVGAWPDSAKVLDEALVSGNADVRLEMTRQLAHAEAGEVRTRIEKTLADAPPPARRSQDQLCALRVAVLQGLAEGKPASLAAAAQMIVAAWPDSEAALDEALVSTAAEVRLEAVRLLSRPELGDVRDRIARMFDDPSEPVRRQAIRAARRLAWPEIEPRFVEALARDRAWSVRQEALRALEDRGTWKCLRAVVEGWAGDRDPDHRRHYRRVLLALLGTDCGDDVDAWRTAVDAAETNGRRPKPTDR